MKEKPFSPNLVSLSPHHAVKLPPHFVMQEQIQKMTLLEAQNDFPRPHRPLRCAIATLFALKTVL